mmetsp:Transcript_54115/g.166517  ORF Transcript_54115/g.166517 Transcript_54115/m.166517 type:complete len:94 (-) Transcript_54115:50-331(-)
MLRSRVATPPPASPDDKTDRPGGGASPAADGRRLRLPVHEGAVAQHIRHLLRETADVSIARYVRGVAGRLADARKQQRSGLNQPNHTTDSIDS